MQSFTTIKHDSFRALRFALQKYESSSANKNKKRKAERLADAVREIVDDIEEQEQFQLTTTMLGMTILKECPVTIDNITYQTAMNAFQAHKAPLSRRLEYASLPCMEAVKRGRTEIIDSEKWDDNRVKLMTNILVAQVAQNDELRSIVLRYGDDKTIIEDSMSDAYWLKTLPRIWKTVNKTLKSDSFDASNFMSATSNREEESDDESEE